MINQNSHSVKKTKTQIYNISSFNSENGSYKSSVRVALPDLIFTNTNIQNVYLSVIHCEVPNSFYIINYTNNSIVINNITYTLTRGNYNANNFITMLLGIIPAGFSMTYSGITNKYTLNYSSNFTINCSNPNCKINKVIGLDNVDVSSTSNSLVFPYNVNFLPLPRINFKSDFFKFGNFSQSDNSSNIFLSLQNNAPQNSIINYSNQTNSKFLVEDKSITSFIINVVDNQGQLINFNNIDWFLTFQIDVEFLEIKTNEDFSSFIPNNLYR